MGRIRYFLAAIGDCDLSVRSYGAALSVGLTVGDIDAWPQRISAVTPADVVAAARNIWRPERLVTAMLTPATGAK